MFKTTIGTTFSLTTFLYNPLVDVKEKVANDQLAKITNLLASWLVGRFMVGRVVARGPNY